MRCSCIARGFGCGSNMGSAVEASYQPSDWAKSKADGSEVGRSSGNDLAAWRDGLTRLPPELDKSTLSLLLCHRDAPLAIASTCPDPVTRWFRGVPLSVDPDVPVLSATLRR